MYVNNNVMTIGRAWIDIGKYALMLKMAQKQLDCNIMNWYIYVYIYKWPMAMFMENITEGPQGGELPEHESSLNYNTEDY